MFVGNYINIQRIEQLYFHDVCTKYCLALLINVCEMFHKLDEIYKILTLNKTNTIQNLLGEEEYISRAQPLLGKSLSNLPQLLHKSDVSPSIRKLEF